MKLADKLGKWQKRAIVFTVDLSMIALSWLCALWMTGNYSTTQYVDSIFTVTLIQCFFSLWCGLYRGMWRFASLPDLMRIGRAIGCATLVMALVHVGLDLSFSVQTYLSYGIFVLLLLSGPRIFYRLLHESGHFFSWGRRVLIVGAGSAAEGLLRDLKRLPLPDPLLPVAMVDDDPDKAGCEVHGVRVMGTCLDIPKIVSRLRIKLILIAIPSVDSHRMREIVALCDASGVPFRTLPYIKDIAEGKVNVKSMREVQLEDLLGREQVKLDWNRIDHTVASRVILVTGGGGSIGAELCRQISRLNPQKLVIVDSNEFNLYSIDMALRHTFPDLPIFPHLCSVTDFVEMKKIFIKYRPEKVFHVAAYKHVPLLQNHLRVSLFNNVLGTRTVSELSGHFGVETFVLISTDKAVNPTNIMGATKRASEVICQSYNAVSNTKFITVRFGNVLDSAGSVIPLFRRQLQQGGPLTVTHPEITRFFMTITEASQLILQAAAMEDEGGIFVLDMGKPIKIHYLAEQMIKLSGRTVGQDVEIKYIGLRPGEKLHEELFHQNEKVSDTSHIKIKRAKARKVDWQSLTCLLDELETASARNDEQRLAQLLNKLVPEYQHSHLPSTSFSHAE